MTAKINNPASVATAARKHFALIGRNATVTVRPDTMIEVIGPRGRRVVGGNGGESSLASAIGAAAEVA